MRLAPRAGHINTKEAWYHVAIVVFGLVALLALYRTLGQPYGTAPLTSGDTKVVAPASPGLARAIDICKFGEVSRQLTDNGSGYRYTAIFGLDVLRWPDDPPGKNPLALVNGDTVTLSDEVMKCLRDKF